jgi:hypothetical protein
MDLFDAPATAIVGRYVYWMKLRDGAWTTKPNRTGVQKLPRHPNSIVRQTVSDGCVCCRRRRSCVTVYTVIQHMRSCTTAMCAHQTHCTNAIANSGRLLLRHVECIPIVFISNYVHILPIAHDNFTASLSLLEEAVRLARLDHEHIVQVYGIVVMHARCPTTTLVLQTAQTTLYDCLWRIVGVPACAPIRVCKQRMSTQQPSLPRNSTLIAICAQMADAVAYMHSFRCVCLRCVGHARASPPLTHGNITCSNVLLNFVHAPHVTQPDLAVHGEYLLQQMMVSVCEHMFYAYTSCSDDAVNPQTYPTTVQQPNVNRTVHMHSSTYGQHSRIWACRCSW